MRKERTTLTLHTNFGVKPFDLKVHASPRGCAELLWDCVIKLLRFSSDKTVQLSFILAKVWPKQRCPIVQGSPPDH